jgi:predicted GNAT family N-acyltransferase
VSSKPKQYIGEFEAKKNQRKFGVRLATPKDAKSISSIMTDAYGYDYLYPKVYSEDELGKSIEKNEVSGKNNVFVAKELWGIAESLDEKMEPAAICLTEKRNEFSIYAGKTVVHNRFRGMGMGRGLGVNSLMNVLNMPENKGIVRLDSDVRSSQLNSQKMVEATGSFAYGFIPNYNNYADKRFYDPLSGKPFTEGRKESVVMYVAPLGNFWEVRSKNVTLIDDENIKSFYEIIKSANRQMKKDELTLLKTPSKQFRNKYDIKEDKFKGTILVTGYMNKIALNKLFKDYKDWNVIEWRVPTTEFGILSQKLAMEQKFVISGYDPGSYKLDCGQLADTLVMCIFPNGIELTQFECIELTKRNRFIASKVINQLTKYYPACKDYM